MREPSKRYKKSKELVDETKLYSLKEAISILKNSPRVKFDESVDIAMNLNIDTKKADQLVRGTVSLPHGTGKKVKVAVFCKGEAEKEALAAGADIVGNNELIDKVAGGFLDFDCAVATPELMKD
ncbi:MAG: 50S ribosomal protein L1, partial [Candidatus Omnitrophota bacterium]